VSPYIRSSTPLTVFERVVLFLFCAGPSSNKNRVGNPMVAPLAHPCSCRLNSSLQRAEGCQFTMPAKLILPWTYWPCWRNATPLRFTWQITRVHCRCPSFLLWPLSVTRQGTASARRNFLVDRGGVVLVGGTLAARNRDGALPLHHILCASTTHNPPARYLDQGFPGSVATKNAA
jgi:hypothetical protein